MNRIHFSSHRSIIGLNRTLQPPIKLLTVSRNYSVYNTKQNCAAQNGSPPYVVNQFTPVTVSSVHFTEVSTQFIFTKIRNKQQIFNVISRSLINRRFVYVTKKHHISRYRSTRSQRRRLETPLTTELSTQFDTPVTCSF
jgi:hypothetical protein